MLTLLIRLKSEGTISDSSSPETLTPLHTADHPAHYNCNDLKYQLSVHDQLISS